MKILHIIPAYLPAYRYGGPIKSVHELNRWLVKKGAEVTVYTTDIDGKSNLDVPRGEAMMLDGVRIFYFPVTWRFWQYSRALQNALLANTRNFDLVHITSVFLSASTLGAHYAKKFKKPYVISPRGSLMEETFHKGFLKKKLYTYFLERRNLAGAAAIHFTAEIEKQEYLSLGLPLNKGILVPNGLDFKELEGEIDPENFKKEYGIFLGGKVILFLSRLSWKKGLDTLIPAFAEVFKKEPAAVLVLAGGDDESYRVKIEKMIREEKLPGGRIIFTGMLAGEDKIGAYKSADVFVLPSYAENFGLVVAEAMYFGVPVVITENVGIAPVVKKFNAGTVVKKDKKELAEAIIKLLRNSKESKKMGTSGRQAVAEEFSWDKIAGNMVKEYNNIIPKGHKI